MPRIIDADKLRKDVLDLPNCYNGFSDAYDKAMIIDLIDEQPTVDAIPVVRCRDCKWWKTNYMWNGSERKVCVIEAYEPVRNEDDYCSLGERKDAKIN